MLGGVVVARGIKIGREQQAKCAEPRQRERQGGDAGGEDDAVGDEQPQEGGDDIAEDGMDQAESRQADGQRHQENEQDQAAVGPVARQDQAAGNGAGHEHRENHRPQAPDRRTAEHARQRGPELRPAHQEDAVVLQAAGGEMLAILRQEKR